jgi:hypothetical protein
MHFSIIGCAADQSGDKNKMGSNQLMPNTAHLKSKLIRTLLYTLLIQEHLLLLAPIADT